MVVRSVIQNHALTKWKKEEAIHAITQLLVFGLNWIG
jgi:hypothetical protein